MNTGETKRLLEYVIKPIEAYNNSWLKFLFKQYAVK